MLELLFLERAYALLELAPNDFIVDELATIGCCNAGLHVGAQLLEKRITWALEHTRIVPSRRRSVRHIGGQLGAIF